MLLKSGSTSKYSSHLLVVYNTFVKTAHSDQLCDTVNTSALVNFNFTNPQTKLLTIDFFFKSCIHISQDLKGLSLQCNKLLFGDFLMIFTVIHMYIWHGNFKI
jgi:hypothetical protein